MVESQIQKKELLEEEVDVSFLIQFVTVEGQYRIISNNINALSLGDSRSGMEHLPNNA